MCGCTINQAGACLSDLRNESLGDLVYMCYIFYCIHWLSSIEADNQLWQLECFKKINVAKIEPYCEWGTEQVLYVYYFIESLRPSENKLKQVRSSEVAVEQGVCQLAMWI